MSTPRRSDRFLRCLFRLYPTHYRERFAEEMEECIRRDLEQTGGGARFWLGLVRDHLCAATAVRRRERRPQRTTSTFLEDLRQGARALWRAPLFTTFASLTLALGIGATTAAFSVLDRVVLRPLPYPGAERMVVVGLVREENTARPGRLNARLMEALAGSPGPAEEVVGLTTGFSVLSGLGEPERVLPAAVTAGFFSFFGARAATGRLFVHEDHATGAPPVAVIGQGLWASRFGADPSVVGTTLDLDGVLHTIVGVVSGSFLPPAAAMSGREDDIWLPLRLGELARDERADFSYTLSAVGRLKASVPATALSAHVAGQVENIYGEYPHRFVGVGTENLHALTVGEIQSVLWRVFAAVGLLLAVACVNVASLLLTRGSERARELTVRFALGAGRRRLVSQLLSESVLLALLSGAIGALVAFVAVESFRHFSPGGIPRLGEVKVDGRALTFSVGAGLTAAVAFGLFPALRSAARSAAFSGRQSTPGPVDVQLRGVLVLAETALAVVLVVGSGLLVHDLLRRVRENPGYSPDGLIAARVALPPERFGNDDRRAIFWRELLEGAMALPGVTSATLAAELPTTDFDGGMELTPDGHDEGRMISTVRVDREFHETIGVELVEGRWFSESDLEGAPVAVVNQAFVDTYWPAERSALGRSLRRGGSFQNQPMVDRYSPGGSSLPEHALWRVVGVVANTRVRPGVGAGPKVFIPVPEAVPACCMELVVRVASDAAALGPALRRLVNRLDPGVVDVNIRTVASLNAQALARPRFYTALLSGFGLAAFLLALVGIYGTTAYATRSRTREIAIRMALGARAGRVVWEVVAHTTAVVAAGVAVGLLVAAVGSRALADALLTLGPRNAVTYGSVAVAVLTAGVAAALVPATRASQVDPASTLREEG